MIYRFVCPSCGRQQEIKMKIDEYRAHGHLCECGEELIRDVSDFCGSYSVNCTGFYSDHPSN